jgi:hypothetical protein
MSAIKRYKLVAISDNKNSFGLNSYIFVAQDGEAWRCLKAREYEFSRLQVGASVMLKAPSGFSSMGFECPESLPTADDKVRQELWGDNAILSTAPKRTNTVTCHVDVTYNPDVTGPEAVIEMLGQSLAAITKGSNACDALGDVTTGPLTIVEPWANPPYYLNLDGPLLKTQRQWLLNMRRNMEDHGGFGGKIDIAVDDLDMLDGLIELTDALADQAHDRYGLDTIIGESANADPNG